LTLATEIHELAANHPTRPRGLHQNTDELVRRFAVQPEPFRAAQCLAHGERYHRDARERGRGDVERSVRGRASPTHAVVIHAWKIVVHQRIRVDDFDGRGQHAGVPPSMEGVIRRHEQESAKPLPLTGQAVVDGIAETGRQLRFPKRDAPELCVDPRAPAADRLFRTIIHAGQ
jgi:hypothetical protein